ncbi:glycoside hydrolase family 47 protein [Auriscalpium vulgare]|uniref:Glycoside hydrolase family 47 protein n=1 Tax=Auriscalpium vulgare TaxID=40419 RepID=A0ACB8RRK6_9AGAM|nr:glycoside hydrolase family 47 protein [Auriscalpium vulgare]
MSPSPPLRVVRDVFLHRSLVVRYVLLPAATLAVLWTLVQLYEPEYSRFRPQRLGFDWEDPFHGPPSHNVPLYPPPPAPSEEPVVAPLPEPAAAPEAPLPLPTPSPPVFTPPSIITSGNLLWTHAAQAVRDAFLHAYHGYEKYAAPHDELLPLTNMSIDSFNGWGVSIYDSLDTMLLMNLTEEFDRAMVTVAQANFSLPTNQFAPFFETTIRYLGGMLSAYALSNNPILLVKADELATKLSPIFATGSGLPFFEVQTDTGAPQLRDVGYLAEVGSCQPEYTYLAKATGKKEHFEKADNIMKVLARANTTDFGGMLPTLWNLGTGRPLDSTLSLGGLGDSGHEYLLKQYLLSGKSDTEALRMYLRATTHIITRMLYLSPNRHMLFPSSTSGIPPHDFPSHTVEHLACFLPGLFALGVQTLPLDDLGSVGIDFVSLGAHLSDAAHGQYHRLARYNLSLVHQWAAEGMAETCATLYADQPSGLGPEEVSILGKPVRWLDELDQWHALGQHGSPPGTAPLAPVSASATWDKRDYSIGRFEYELRPETIESMYMLWRMSGNERWREHGLRMFVAIERETKTAAGYSTVWSVGVSPASRKDSMPSFFLAETLKYLYLLFTDEELLPLDKWVFNTEAHPLPVFHWNEAEKAAFNIVA